MPDDQTPKIILNTVPLQPVPQVQPQPTPAPAATPDPTQRRAQVQAELEQLQQEENSLLSNMKDWLAKIQGSETKQQALERELFELDKAAPAGPDPIVRQAELQKQLQQAQAKLAQVVNQQKIDEKKAFDNYSAGGLDRQGLLEEMERVRQRYADAQATTQQAVAAAQKQLETLAAPMPQTQPVPQPTPQPVTAPVSTATMTGLMQKLIALPEIQSGLGKQLLIDLPNQGTLPTIERAADGNGIMIYSSTAAGFLADADLLRAGVTAEDLISLPVSSHASSEATPLIPA